MSALTDDVVALQRLQAAYADVVTRRAWAELGGLFLGDAEVHVDTVTRPPRVLRGPDELGAFIDGAVGRFDHFAFVVLNSVVEPQGDAARGRIFMVELRHEADGDRWSTAHGVYQDDYRRVEGRWWFARRRYRSLARTGPQAAVHGLPGDLWPLAGTTEEA